MSRTLNVSGHAWLINALVTVVTWGIWGAFSGLPAQHGFPDTLVYVDPPYMFACRSQKRIGNDLYHGYRHELSDDDQAALLAQLIDSDAMVIVSGYPTPLYDETFRAAGWRRVEKDAWADRGAARTEVLWLNPACVRAIAHGPLFHDRVPA